MGSKVSEEEVKIALDSCKELFCIWVGILLDISLFRFYFWYMYTDFHMVFHAKEVECIQ